MGSNAWVAMPQQKIHPIFVVNQQAATPTPSSHCTEARVSAAAAININADQLMAIPRRLHKPSESAELLLTQPRVNHGCQMTNSVHGLFSCLFIFFFMSLSPCVSLSVRPPGTLGSSILTVLHISSSPVLLLTSVEGKAEKLTVLVLLCTSWISTFPLDFVPAELWHSSL